MYGSDSEEETIHEDILEQFVLLEHPNQGLMKNASNSRCLDASTIKRKIETKDDTEKEELLDLSLDSLNTGDNIVFNSSHARNIHETDNDVTEVDFTDIFKLSKSGEEEPPEVPSVFHLPGRYLLSSSSMLEPKSTDSLLSDTEPNSNDFLEVENGKDIFNMTNFSDFKLESNWLSNFCQKNGIDANSQEFRDDEEICEQFKTGSALCLPLISTKKENLDPATKFTKDTINKSMLFDFPSEALSFTVKSIKHQDELDLEESEFSIAEVDVVDNTNNSVKETEIQHGLDTANIEQDKNRIDEDNTPSVNEYKSKNEDNKSPVDEDKSINEDDKPPGDKTTPMNEDNTPPVDEDKSINEDNKSPLGENKPINEDDKPPVDETKPINEDNKSPVGEDKPINVEDEPPVGEDKPINEDEEPPVDEGKPMNEDNKLFVDKPQDDVAEPLIDLVSVSEPPFEDDKSLLPDSEPLVDESKSLVEETETLDKYAKPLAKDFKPLVDDFKPSDEDAEPIVEDAEPMVEDAEPILEDYEPLVEDDKPLVEDAEPSVVDAEPLVEDAEPLVENIKPILEDVKPLVKDDKPLVENDKPLVEDTEPQVEDDKTLVENTEPLVGDAKSLVEDAKTLVEDAEPLVKDTEPLVENDKPLVGDAEPLVEDAELLVEDAELLVEDDKPLVGDAKPLVEDAELLVENIKPLLEDVEPLVEDDKPLVENDKPLVEDAEPQVEDDKTLVEDAKPLIEYDQPLVEDAKPLVGDAEPLVEATEPENYKHRVDHIEPLVEDAKPLVEDTEHLVEGTEPLVENDKPLVEDDQPLVKDAEPLLEDDQTLVTDAEPLVEDDQPLVEDAKLLVEDNTPLVEGTKPENYKPRVDHDEPLMENDVPPAEITDLPIEDSEVSPKPEVKEYEPLDEDIKLVIKELCDMENGPVNKELLEGCDSSAEKYLNKNITGVKYILEKDFYSGDEISKKNVDVQEPVALTSLKEAKESSNNNQLLVEGQIQSGDQKQKMIQSERIRKVEPVKDVLDTEQLEDIGYSTTESYSLKITENRVEDHHFKNSNKWVHDESIINDDCTKAEEKLEYCSIENLNMKKFISMTADLEIVEKFELSSDDDWDMNVKTKEHDENFSSGNSVEQRLTSSVGSHNNINTTFDQEVQKFKNNASSPQDLNSTYYERNI